MKFSKNRFLSNLVSGAMVCFFLAGTFPAFAAISPVPLVYTTNTPSSSSLSSFTVTTAGVVTIAFTGSANYSQAEGGGDFSNTDLTYATPESDGTASLLINGPQSNTLTIAVNTGCNGSLSVTGTGVSFAVSGGSGSLSPFSCAASAPSNTSNGVLSGNATASNRSTDQNTINTNVLGSFSGGENQCSEGASYLGTYTFYATPGTYTLQTVTCSGTFGFVSGSELHVSAGSSITITSISQATPQIPTGSISANSNSEGAGGVTITWTITPPQ